MCAALLTRSSSLGSSYPSWSWSSKIWRSTSPLKSRYIPIPATYTTVHVCMYVHSKKLGETTVFSQSSSYMTVWKFHARFWMTKMSDGGSEPPTTSQRPEWNRSSAQCPWDLTMGGTRSSSISPTSPGELTGPTTLRLLGSRWVMSRSWKSVPAV